MGHAYGAGMWHRTVPELAASYRVIRFDNRGVGCSSDPPGPYSVQLMAEDALAVLDTAGHAYITDAARAANQEVLRFLAGIPGPGRRLRHQHAPGDQHGGHVNGYDGLSGPGHGWAVEDRAESRIRAFSGIPCAALPFGTNQTQPAAAGPGMAWRT